MFLIIKMMYAPSMWANIDTSISNTMYSLTGRQTKSLYAKKKHLNVKMNGT